MFIIREPVTVPLVFLYLHGPQDYFTLYIYLECIMLNGINGARIPPSIYCWVLSMGKWHGASIL